MDTYLYKVSIHYTRPVGTLSAAHATCSETCCTSSDVFNTRTVNWTKVAERSVWCFLLTMESDNALAISVEMEEKKPPLCQNCKTLMI